MIQQLYISKSKKKEIAVRLFLLIFFTIAITIIVLPKNILASPYGDCTYGAGQYGQNDCNEQSASVPSTTESTPPASTDSSEPSTTTATNDKTSSFSVFDPITNTTTTMSTDSTTNSNTQTPTLRGHTVPYATVIIEISPSFKVEVIADENGDWEYKVTSPLEFGEHTIKITIKEKDTDKLISENSYKINITEKATEVSNTEVSNNDTGSSQNHRTLTIIGIIALILSALILIIIYVAKIRRKHN